MSPLRITVIDHQTRQIVCERSFTDFPVKIGRGDDNHLALPYPFVSGAHAEVRRDRDALHLHVLAARNGLAIGARRLEPGASIAVERRLVAAIGSLELRLDAAHADAPAPAPAPDGPDLSALLAAPRDLPATSGTIDPDALPILPD